MDEVITESIITEVSKADFSLFSLFLQADWVVKLVIIMLVLASIWCWAIIIEKLVTLNKIQKSTEMFENKFWSGHSLEELFESIRKGAVNPMSAVFGSAMKEWQQSRKISNHHELNSASLLQRIERSMHVTISREMSRLERYMTFLASVGSTAPFVGLFGTVWGIMNSFQAIALEESSNLAVVAPGIAEALFATALGLVAAIPAVIAYNKISNMLMKYQDRLEHFSEEFSSIVSRQMEYKNRAA